MSSQEKRLLGATVCVVLLTCAPLIGTSVASHVQESKVLVSEETTWEQLPTQFVPQKSIPQDLFNKLANPPAQSPVPEFFIEEVCDPNQFGQAESYVEDGLVGACWQSESSASFDSINAYLQEKGWERIGTNQSATTYIKQQGRVRWLYVCIFQMKDATTVLFAYTGSED